MKLTFGKHMIKIIAYDTNGNVTSELYKVWLQGSSQWVNDYRFTYTFDTAGNMTSQLNEH